MSKTVVLTCVYDEGQVGWLKFLCRECSQAASLDLLPGEFWITLYRLATEGAVCGRCLHSEAPPLPEDFELDMPFNLGEAGFSLAHLF